MNSLDLAKINKLPAVPIVFNQYYQIWVTISGIAFFILAVDSQIVIDRPHMDELEAHILSQDEEDPDLELAEEELYQHQAIALGVLCFVGAEAAHQHQAEVIYYVSSSTSSAGGGFAS